MHPHRKKYTPDELLQRIESDKRGVVRGRLKIFFGSCPGVGKTYAMLLAAHEHRKEGADVVVGIVETHKRSETERLLEGLPCIQPLEIAHRRMILKELDIDAIKVRKPSIVLVDELAHTNAPHMRHPKRWNDVEELLDAGIDVYTTLNVQHVESLSDVVAGTTGVWVKETVPDSVFDTAEDIILVDINVDELLKRLHEGKVYIAPEARQRAKDNFFKERNLIALREIALRRTAERVDAQMHALNPWESTDDIIPVADKIMVCIGPDPLSGQLVRTAKRVATSLKAPWVAVYVENMRHYRLNRRGRQMAKQAAHMAERMGGESVVIQGDSAADDIIAYAKANHVTKIIIGKPVKSGWKAKLYGSLADKVIHKSGYIDVYVVTSKPDAEGASVGKSDLILFRPGLYTWAVLTIAVLTMIGMELVKIITPIDQAMIYLVGGIFVATKFGRGPSLLYSLVSVSCLNFFFIPPIYSFDIYDRSYWLTLVVMLITSLVITGQASRLRLQAVFSRKREQDTQIFYTLTRELASSRSRQDISNVAARHITEMFEVTSMIALPDEAGQVKPTTGQLPFMDAVKESGVLQWCFDNGQTAGRHTMTMPSANGLYFPLIASSGTLGVLGIVPTHTEAEFSGDELSSLETCASLLASALERAKSTEMAEKSRLEVESEKLRTMLLSSVSHDLRSPLASITGAASTIATDIDQLSRDTIRDLGQSINKEAERLSHLVSNLLEVTRLESDTVQLNRQPYFIEELIGSALVRLEQVLAKYKVVPQSDEGLPLVFVDGVLIEQVLINLLENAVHYTPPGSTIIISAIKRDETVLVSIKDNGPGFAVGEERKIFDKFYSVSRTGGNKGTGLGLAICASIIKVHKGEIWAENLPTGGACFSFTLPVASETQTEVRHSHDS